MTDDNDLEDKLLAEQNARIKRDNELTKQLDYVSQVFSTYTNYWIKRSRKITKIMLDSVMLQNIITYYRILYFMIYGDKFL